MAEPSHNPAHLPPDLPIPTDDGGASHLRRGVLPNLNLPSTAGGTRNLRNLPSGPGRNVVLFFFPRTGVPGEPPALRDGLSWDQLPGARGCTPQSCGFRDLHQAFNMLGIDVYGVSTSTPEHQLEFVRRNHIPFELLSDHRLELIRELRLPTFEWPVASGGPTTLMRRMAWYVEVDEDKAAYVRKVWYPVFPPDRCAHTVLEWLRRRLEISIGPSSLVSPGEVEGALLREFHSTTIESRGRSFDTRKLKSFVAQRRGEFVGLVTMNIVPPEAEVITLQALAQGEGIGSTLLHFAECVAQYAGCRRIFLTTSNDNLHALGFYQRQGWRIVAVHTNAINAARTRNPGLPLMTGSGILSQDEIELELVL
ncbi:MAG: GNAT family N-acetyltransferase [Planctomycetota bacterium]